MKGVIWRIDMTKTSVIFKRDMKKITMARLANVNMRKFVSESKIETGAISVIISKIAEILWILDKFRL